MELKPLKIGNIEIDFPVVLAALAGYSDLPYRLICREHGSPYCATEAMLDRQMLLDGKLRRRLVQLTDEDHPAAAQIMGNDPAVMSQAAKVLCEMGFDVIDLNFACPVRKVISRRRGGHMMRTPQRTLEIVRAVLDVVRDRPVTLKLRRAYLQSDLTCEAFWEIARGAFQAGAAALCVHARSVEQKYMGQADWGFLSAVKQAFPDKTIIGSGDIHCAADALRMIEATGVDGVAAARGAIGNPWIFRQARDLAAGREPHRPSLSEQREVLSKHFELACKVHGSIRGPKGMRKFGIKYARMHPTPSKVRNAFVDIKSAAQWQAVLAEFYAGA
jgi:nifR3 family TIM-barrel protein